MPVYLRRFYIKKLIDVKKEEEAHIKKSQSKKPSVKMPQKPSRYR
tara:strand:- start:552 stop:686 length:135 start_codon:yes stop_codon:yes gene_type:complete